VVISNDVVRSSLRPAWQQSHHDVPALRSAGNVVDVLADLELVHGVAPASLAEGRPSEDGAGLVS
jgi:hypothetical protein